MLTFLIPDNRTHLIDIEKSVNTENTLKIWQLPNYLYYMSESICILLEGIIFLS